LLGDNKSSGADMLRPMRYQCAGSLDFIRTPLYIYIYSWHMYTQLQHRPDLTERNYCLSRGVSLCLCLSVHSTSAAMLPHHTQQQISAFYISLTVHFYNSLFKTPTKCT
jgi:hypothetical protein